MLQYTFALLLLLIASLSFAQSIEIQELEINEESYTVLDFGTIQPKKTSKKQLHLINTGTADLIITKLEEGCECTSVNIKKKTLKPNQSTIICLKWKPIDSSEFHSSIMIHSNANNHPQLWIQIEGNVEE